MKCISLWQPWASLWASGHKKIETRSWPIRGTFPQTWAVHAAKKFDRDEQALCIQEPFRTALAAIGYTKVGHLPLGCVVGVVTVAFMIEFKRDDEPMPEPERYFGNHAPGRFGWMTTENRLLATPIPLRGHQGPWEWEPPELVFADGGKLTAEALRFGAIAQQEAARKTKTGRTLFDDVPVTAT